jgi:hypothetical protein
MSLNMKSSEPRGPWNCLTCAKKDGDGTDIFVENRWEGKSCWKCGALRPRPDKLKEIEAIRRSLKTITGDPYIEEQESQVVWAIYGKLTKLENLYLTGLNILRD